jgi:hypothetical protein
MGQAAQHFIPPMGGMNIRAVCQIQIFGNSHVVKDFNHETHETHEIKLFNNFRVFRG